METLLLTHALGINEIDLLDLISIVGLFVVTLGTDEWLRDDKATFHMARHAMAVVAGSAFFIFSQMALTKITPDYALVAGKTIELVEHEIDKSHLDCLAGRNLFERPFGNEISTAMIDSINQEMVESTGKTKAECDSLKMRSQNAVIDFKGRILGNRGNQ